MRLIIIVAFVISGFAAIGLVFFQATRKTYPGFGRWTAGVGFLTLGYLALALRGFIPDAFSIFLSNGGFSVGMVFLLDGLRRFLGLTPMSGVWYALPAMDLVAIAVLYYLYDLTFWRTVVTAIAISAPHWPMAALIFRHPVKHKSIFYPVIGALLCLAGLVVLARPVSAFFLPQWHLFMNSPFQLGSLITLIVLQLGESLSLMMLNSERVETELTEAEAKLRLTVDQLQQALAEQKRAEEALRHSQQKLSLALEGANVGIWEWDLITGKALWSERIHRMLGYESNEFEPTLKNWKKVVHPEDWARVSQNLNLHIEGKLPIFEVEYRRLNKSGDWQWVHAQGKVIEVDADGKPIRMTGVVADATDRKRADEELQKQVSLMESLLEAIPAPVFFKDTNHIYLGCNGPFAEFIGLPKENIIGKSVFEVAPIELANVYRVQDEALFKNPIPQIYESSVKSSDGTSHDVMFHKAAFADSSGAVAGLIGVILDITDRKKAEEALRENEESYRDLVENIEDLICTHDLEGNLLFVNQSPAKVLGYASGELIGRNLRSILAPEVRDQFDAYLAAIRKDGQTSGLMLVQTKSGEKRIWEYRNTLRTEGPGAPIIRGLARDMTDRKKAEEERERLKNQLLQAQKMEAIGTLTGGIAHDFNNLLTIINGFAEMILLETKEEDPRHKDLKKILQTGQKGADMVQRLLAFSKKAQVSLQPLDLNSIVENSIKVMEGTFPKMIEIQAVLSDDLALVDADSGQMEQLLMNICVNARDAMPDGGRLKIETKNITVDEDYCRLHVRAKLGRHVLIEVSDTGTGMSKKTMDRIFDPFFTTKGWDFRKGTGLGLSVAKGIVEQHGGWITCQSEPGKGTTFTVYFPTNEGSLDVPGTGSAGEIVPGETKILLVDDEELVRDLGKRILEHAGYKVITAGNGKEAVETYSREQSDIALVVLDLVMPKMGGEKCLEELFQINPHVKVIISTGRSLDAQERLHLGSLARGFLDKPYEVGQMAQAVKAVLGAARDA